MALKQQDSAPYRHMGRNMKIDNIGKHHRI